MDRKKVTELFQLLSYCLSFQLTWSWHWYSESDIWAWPAGFLLDSAERERERERETRGWLQGWRWEEGLACPCMPVVPATITLAMLLHIGSDTSFLKQQLKPVCSFSNTLRTSFMTPSQRQQPQGFPGGTVVKNLPANAGDTGSSPGLGRSHMPRSN